MRVLEHSASLIRSCGDILMAAIVGGIATPSDAVATATLLDTNLSFRELGSLSCFRKGQG